MACERCLLEFLREEGVMFRTLMWGLVVAAAAGVAGARPADAAPVSARNPYRSFNISGVNYGSMQWERAHRGRASSGHRFGGFMFRHRR